MAEGFLNKMLQNKNDENAEVRVISAGLHAYGGSPTGEAIEVMRAEGIDISGYKSKQLTRGLIEEADLILTMKKEYKDVIVSRYPEFKHKVFTLKEFAGETEDLDIHDPYGEGLKAYEACASEIKRILTRAFEKIVN
ncbi:low molecular weight protein arginine phosphatase [Candidatus Bathyarchaeota archaeon]|nr:MAG: low molecular weight protein arginine phosphatase [Candidatus Bathyarchaeota archaeon]